VWWSLVVAAAPTEARIASADPAFVERVCGELAAARGRWPESSAITDGALADAVTGALVEQRDAAALGRLRIEDLLLARWCASGDPRAIAAFEQVYARDLDAVILRFRRLAMKPEEIRQLLRIRMFVGAPPRIASYAGFGHLQNWVRVTALRVLVDLARSERARRLEELLSDDAFAELPALGPDVGARRSREEVSRAIKQAFARAVAGLTPRQRNYLRHAHVDQLTLDQIASLYGIHRATVARTLAQARAELTTATREDVARELGVAQESLDSIVRVADTKIDLSLSRVLRDPEEPDEPIAEAP
jgi:RNA polymerase sigma-70 factor (ECF subfamily)